MSSASSALALSQSLRRRTAYQARRLTLLNRHQTNRILSARAQVRESLINDYYRTTEDGRVEMTTPEDREDPRRISDRLMSNIYSYNEQVREDRSRRAFERMNSSVNSPPPPHPLLDEPVDRPAQPETPPEDSPSSPGRPAFAVTHPPPEEEWPPLRTPLPPLQELIWRRLRRRAEQAAEAASTEPGAAAAASARARVEQSIQLRQSMNTEQSAPAASAPSGGNSSSSAINAMWNRHHGGNARESSSAREARHWYIAERAREDTLRSSGGGSGGSGGREASPANRARNREFLSWMVDQMRIDQPSGGGGAALDPVASLGGPEAAAASEGSQSAAASAIIRRRVSQAMGDVAAARGENNHPPSSRAAQADRQPHELYQFLQPPGVQQQQQQFRIERERQRAEERDRYSQAQCNNMLVTHRIQSWDFSQYEIPDLRDSTSNLVVKEARIHNDASVDVSEDGDILVTLVPSVLPMTTVVGVFGLKPKSEFGRCFATCSLESSSAVSVSLSPTSRHLIVGLTIRTASRIAVALGDRSLMAQVFRIVLPPSKGEGGGGGGSAGGGGGGGRGRLELRRNIHMTQQTPSLNCVKWIPLPGQGIVYATNTGLLKILR